jgi:hypothetical protein
MDDELEQCAPGDTACERRNDGIRFGENVRSVAWVAVLAIVLIGVVSIWW